MSKLLKRFLGDEAGTASAEWAFVATILVLGAVTGLVMSRQVPPMSSDVPVVVRSR